MKYCSKCGSSKLVYEEPESDNRPRYSCENCQKIFYDNPRVIAGCIVEADDKYLLCQRAIKPRVGTWTLPAGYMECGETMEQAAEREVWEEAGARVEVIAPYSMFSIPHIDQVYIIYRAELLEISHSAGDESLQVDLFSPKQIPWDNIFYPAVKDVLERYIQEKQQGNFGIYAGSVESGVVHFVR